MKNLIRLSSASVTENFSKKNTHLLCPDRTPSLKLVKAFKWSIPVVDLDWLKSCYTNGTSQCIPSDAELPPKCRGESSCTDMKDRSNIGHHSRVSPQEETFVKNTANCNIIRTPEMDVTTQNTYRSADKQHPLSTDNSYETDVLSTSTSLFPYSAGTGYPMDKSSEVVENTDSKSSDVSSTFARLVDGYVRESEKNKRRKCRDLKKESVFSDWDSFFKKPVSFCYPSLRKNSTKDNSARGDDIFLGSTDILHIGGTDIIYDDPSGRKLKRKLVEQLGKSTTRESSETESHNLKYAGDIEPIFMLSGFSSSESEAMALSIRALGGNVILSRKWDNRCTHLIADRISAREKCLAAICRGCWVLKSSYIYESSKSKKLLREEDFEWSEYPSVELGSRAKGSSIFFFCFVYLTT